MFTKRMYFLLDGTRLIVGLLHKKKIIEIIVTKCKIVVDKPKISDIIMVKNNR